MSEHVESEQFIQKKRGRPKGYRLSQETRLKISETRSTQEKQKKRKSKPPLECATPGVPSEVVEAVMLRDTRTIGKETALRCRGCHDKGPKLSIFTFIPPNTTDLLGVLRDPENSAVLCSFCRDYAEVSGMVPY